MSKETFTFSFLVLVALSIAVPAILRWKVRRMVRTSIGLERICRRADLVERELKFSVLDSLKYSDGSRVIRVAFSFEHGMQGVSGNGWISFDPVEVHTGSDSHNRAVEAQIIAAIDKSRAFHANAT